MSSWVLQYACVLWCCKSLEWENTRAVARLKDEKKNLTNRSWIACGGCFGCNCAFKASSSAFCMEKFASGELLFNLLSFLVSESHNRNRCAHNESCIHSLWIHLTVSHEHWAPIHICVKQQRLEMLRKNSSHNDMEIIKNGCKEADDIQKKSVRGKYSIYIVNRLFYILCIQRRFTPAVAIIYPRT